MNESKDDLKWVNELYVKLNFNKRYRNNKTENMYYVSDPTNPEITNCTNAQDGTAMVLYTDGQQIFVREYNEFQQKFVEVTND